MTIQQAQQYKTTAPKSSKMMGGKKSKNKKTEAARADLIARSQLAKQRIKKAIDNAQTEIEQRYAASLTINTVLVEQYAKDSGCKTFHTFQDWKKAGYRVIKGAKAFRIWGRPLRVNNKSQDEQGNDLDSASWEFWPMCCLFNESQVEKEDGNDADVDTSTSLQLVDKQLDVTTKENTPMVNLKTESATCLSSESKQKPSTTQLLNTVKENDQDFEWYPTTDEIITTIQQDIEHIEGYEHPSILDCGAGDGRVLNALTQGDKYAIEKSTPLLNALDKSIFIVGTEFREQTLIDKKVDIIFSNPPYSEFEAWAVKIITEAHARTIYLVIPERWAKNTLIQQALDDREAEATTIGQFDFIDAERSARANVEVVKIELSYRDRYSRSTPKIDPFKHWFEENFKLDIAKTEHSQHDLNRQSQSTLQDEVSQALVKGDNVIPVLDALYQRDMQKLITTYQQLSDIDPALLAEMDINIEGVRGALQLKINGLKDRYWHELFNHLSSVTNRLTAQSRKQLLATLTAHTHVDFSTANAYAIAIWVIKNANVYFDSQLIKTVETLTEKANVHNYTSNKKTFGDEQWRYCRTPEGLDHYKLDYRIVLEHAGGLCNATYSFERSKNGLSKHASIFLNDLCTIASNLGFDTTQYGGSSSFHWDTHVKNCFLFHNTKTGTDDILFEAKAFKNGNLHIKFNQAFMCRLNVEFGRLKGWIKSPKEAQQELNITPEEACEHFQSNLTLEHNHLLQLGFQQAS